jgi:hypothetical protein
MSPMRRGHEDRCVALSAHFHEDRRVVCLDGRRADFEVFDSRDGGSLDTRRSDSSCDVYPGLWIVQSAWCLASVRQCVSLFSMIVRPPSD